MPLDWQGQWDQPELDAEFKNDLQAVLGPDEDSWRVVRPCYRSIADQDALYAKGRTADGEIVTQAKGGQSAHNWGLAADICRLVGTGITQKERWDYDHPAWARVMAVVDKHPRLHGGWTFPKPDEDHIQAVKWRTKRQQLIDAGQW